MAERIDELVDRLHSRVPQGVTDWFALRPELIERNREITRGSILAEIECLGRGAVLPDEIPGVDADLARLAAYLGSPLEYMLWGYRNGHRVQWEAFLDVLEATDAPAADKRRLMDEAAAFFFTYADRLSDLVTQVYTEERESLLRGSEQRRMQAVARLLEGGPADARQLDYDPEGQHIGLVLAGADGPAVANALASLLDRRALVVAVDDGLWWAWLGGKIPVGGIALRGALAGWTAPDGTSVAVGGEAAGSSGFAVTHREAAAAHVARPDRGVFLFEDFALESLVSADTGAAERFVARELAGIDAADHRSTVLRETLVAWFSHGQNAAATAAALGVHEQTVAQRLRAVEERIGRPPALRRAELEVALRLRAAQTV